MGGPAAIDSAVLSTFSANIKSNTCTPTQLNILNTIIGFKIEGSKRTIIKGSLADLLNYVATEYKGNKNCTIFPNNHYKDGILMNYMTFIHAPGISQNSQEKHVFVGQGPEEKPNNEEKKSHTMYGCVQNIEQAIPGTCTLGFTHTADPLANQDNIQYTQFLLSFFNTNGGNEMTVKKLYDLLYVPVWYKIVDELIYNNITLYTAPFNGSQIYYYQDKTTLKDVIKEDKLVRICDLADIRFGYTNISNVIYPWFLDYT